MSVSFEVWLDQLRQRNQRFVDASRECNYDRGIWNATVEKYPDPIHFVFELLQNAEDAGATRALFRLEPDAISFEHDGRFFDRGDIEGVTGIGNTTKTGEANKIGCFGIGFKSVYSVTDAPEIHCRIEGRVRAFTIRDLVVPEMIATGHEGETTLIRLPVPPGRAPALLAQVRATLESRAARSLLFLTSLRSLTWSHGSIGAACEAENVGGLRQIRARGTAGDSAERFLLLARPVSREGDPRDYTVKVAYRVNDLGEIVPEPTPTPLAVYFDTEEVTGLHFQVHGPFLLTDNRANMKREDPWNQLLVRELGVLIADGLDILRDKGLLKRSFLEVMPNSIDELPQTWAPLRKVVLEAFQARPLLPTHCGDHVRVGDGVRGPSDVREALADEGLEQLGGLKGTRWVVGGLRGSRTDALLTSLQVREFGFIQVLDAVRQTFGCPWRSLERIRAEAWFDSLPDDQVQRLYLVLDQATQQQKRPCLVDIPFVRLESGQRVEPKMARLAPSGATKDNDLTSLGADFVRSALLRGGRSRGKEVEQFLRRVGVPEISECDWLSAILRDHYGPLSTAPTIERHLQHISRFVRHYKATGEADLLREVRWVRVEGQDGMFSPDDVFLPPPFGKNQLDRIYSGHIAGRDRHPLWSGYASFKDRAEFVKMLVAAGAEDALAIEDASPTRNPSWQHLSNGFHGTRNTGTGVCDDYVIPQLAAILELRDVEVSRMVWSAVSKQGRHTMWAHWSPNKSREPNRVLSQMAVVLRDAKWIPALDGSFRRPDKITVSELAPGFSIQPALPWLEEIGFGAEDRRRSEQHQARRKAAESLEMPEELADRLGAMSEEGRAAIYIEMARRIADGAFRRPQFPESQSEHPERRAARVALRAQAAPKKAHEVRERSVRTSGRDEREMARVYLRDLYTNPMKQMVCQGCQEEMPFRLAHGEYYFEAAELLPFVSVELTENHLALCPTCAAKWQHARTTSDEEILERISNGDKTELNVALAGESVTLRFVKRHFEDVRAALSGFDNLRAQASG